MNFPKMLWLGAVLLAAGWILAGEKAWAYCDTCPENQPMDKQTQEGILRQADDIFKEVSRLRGLPIKYPVKKAFEDKAFFRNYYLQLLREQYPPEKKRGIEKAYALIGFLPPNADLIQTYLDSFLKAVQGLYDPKTKTLYIGNWVEADKLEGTMAHELTHALQDQAYGLQAFMDRGKDDTLDARFARSSVMEGDAVATALNYSLEDKGEDFTQMVNIAEWVRLSNLLEESGQKAFGRKVAIHDVINFPYVNGAAFLQKYVKAYGWQGMKFLFENPPSSTHQIMHPETFFPKRRNPVRIKIDDLSPAILGNYSRIWEDSFGEYGLFLLLRQYLPEDEARNSVRGWKGDLMQVYEAKDGGPSILAGYVVFNDDESAGDFFKSYRSLLNSKYNADIIRRSDDTIHWVSLGQGDMEVYVERFGRRVVFIEGTSSSQTAKVRSALWDVSRGGSPGK